MAPRKQPYTEYAAGEVRYDEYSDTPSAAESKDRAIGMFIVKKIVHEATPIMNSGSLTIGEFIDHSLCQSAKNREHIFSVTVEMPEDEWEAYAERARNS